MGHPRRRQQNHRHHRPCLTCGPDLPTAAGITLIPLCRTHPRCRRHASSPRASRKPPAPCLHPPCAPARRLAPALSPRPSSAPGLAFPPPPSIGTSKPDGLMSTSSPWPARAKFRSTNPPSPGSAKNAVAAALSEHRLQSPTRTASRRPGFLLPIGARSENQHPFPALKNGALHTLFELLNRGGFSPEFTNLSADPHFQT